MRNVIKGPEPQALAEARRTAKLGGLDVDKGDWQSVNRREIRAALYRDQLGVCAYCCGRITARRDPKDPDVWEVPAVDEGNPRKGGLKVEHWVPRSGYPDSDLEERRACEARALDWGNLLGVCSGISLVEDRKNQYHCDKARGNSRLWLHPVETPNLSWRFRINPSSGELRAASPEDREVGQDLETLNLNVGRLRANRQAAIDQVRKMVRRDDGKKNLKRLWRMATRADNFGRLPAYAPAVALYLEKKLKARNMSLEGD